MESQINSGSMNGIGKVQSKEQLIEILGENTDEDDDITTITQKKKKKTNYGSEEIF